MALDYGSRTPGSTSTLPLTVVCAGPTRCHSFLSSASLVHRDDASHWQHRQEGEGGMSRAWGQSRVVFLFPLAPSLAPLHQLGILAGEMEA